MRKTCNNPFLSTTISSSNGYSTSYPVSPKDILPKVHKKTHFKALQTVLMDPTAHSLCPDDGSYEPVVRDINLAIIKRRALKNKQEVNMKTLEIDEA